MNSSARCRYPSRCPEGPPGQYSGRALDPEALHRSCPPYTTERAPETAGGFACRCRVARAGVTPWHPPFLLRVNIIKQSRRPQRSSAQQRFSCTHLLHETLITDLSNPAPPSIHRPIHPPPQTTYPGPDPHDALRPPAISQAPTLSQILWTVHLATPPPFTPPPHLSHRLPSAPPPPSPPHIPPPLPILPSPSRSSPIFPLATPPHCTRRSTPISDSYIDKFETLLYDRFAASQILLLILGMDTDLDPAVKVVSARITATSDAMEAALKKAGEIELITYAAAGSTPTDPVAEARRVLRQAISCAESRDDGAAIVADMLNDESMGTVLKRRPVKLTDAIKGIEKHKASLKEGADWTAKLTAARDALEKLNQNVRKARSDRRSMPPELAAAREAWLVTYNSAKDIVSGVLRQRGRLSMLSEIFDDLAEVHRIAGVTDETPAPALPSSPSSPSNRPEQPRPMDRGAPRRRFARLARQRHRGVLRAAEPRFGRHQRAVEQCTSPDARGDHRDHPSHASIGTGARTQRPSAVTTPGNRVHRT
ncbi:Hypothetical protein A7982_01249 [Minicystis rosea]|nr:Hypothetical protein A7982_01249 [Minicystis rosea]